MKYLLAAWATAKYIYSEWNIAIYIYSDIPTHSRSYGIFDPPQIAEKGIQFCED